MTKVIFYGIKPWEAEYLKGKLAVEAVFHPELVSKDHLPLETDAEIISVFVDSAVDQTVLGALPNLRFIATRSTGFDHLDLASCRERGIVVSSVPSYGENTVAEQAFALILALSRKIYQAYDQIREQGNFSFDDLQGFDLKGKTIGIVGTGRIGRHAIKMATGFDMKILAYDPYPNPELQKQFAFEYVPLDELLAQSDIVTLHVPYTPETHHLIDAAHFAKMKRGAYLINTSRGGLVETEALVAALHEGRLGGAGLDVLEEEAIFKNEMDFLIRGRSEGHNLKTILANHILIDLPNVIITPHNAFNTKEALQRILDTTVENINGFLAGQPINVVK